MQLVLDAHTDKLSSGSVSDNFRGFKTVIDGKDKYPFTSRNGFLIRSGQDNQIAVTATRFEANENIRPINPLKRNCYFSNEYPLKLHKAYTQANCFVQCKLEHARNLMYKENKTAGRCMPWFYPREDQYLSEICNPWRTKRFQLLLEEISDDICDECLPDCSITKYKASVTAAPFRSCDRTNLGVSQMCDLTIDGNIVINPPIYEQMILDEYEKFNDGNIPDFIKDKNSTFSNIRKYESTDTDMKKLVFRADRERKPNYNAFEEDIAIVNFYFDEPTVVQYSTFESMTWKDYISQVSRRNGFFKSLKTTSKI